MLCDSMGLEEGEEAGLCIDDIPHILQGCVPDRYQVRCPPLQDTLNCLIAFDLTRPFGLPHVIPTLICGCVCVCVPLCVCVCSCSRPLINKTKWQDSTYLNSRGGSQGGFVYMVLFMSTMSEEVI